MCTPARYFSLLFLVFRDVLGGKDLGNLEKQG